MIKEYYNSYGEHEIIKSIENGFEIALEEGPLCAEQIFGKFFFSKERLHLYCGRFCFSETRRILEKRGGDASAEKKRWHIRTPKL